MSRKIDAAVAEEVMGHEVMKPHPDVWFMYPNREHSAVEIPNYSTDIRAAWEVVEKMNEDGWCCALYSNPIPN